jgi:hypothetical protein
VSYMPERIQLHDGILLAVYIHFYNEADWPRYRRVELEWENELSVVGGLYKVLREIGSKYVLCDSPELEDTKVSLTIEGVARCGAQARGDLGRLLQVARFSANVYRRNFGVAAARFSLANVFEGADAQSLEIRRLAQLLRMCEWTGPLGGLDFQARRPSMVLDNVTTIDDYLKRLAAHNAQRRVEMSAGPVAAPMAPSRLFLSHYGQDEAIAKYVGTALQLALPSTGVFVASMPGHIRVGEEWLQVIFGQIREADVYIVIMTPRSIARPWVWFESGAAWMSEKRLIVVTAGGLAKGGVPMPLSIYQALDLTDPIDAQQLFDDLAATPTDIDAFCRYIASLSDGMVQ